MSASENPSPRVYLDNAATSWPKPESVYLAVDQFQRTLGASAGRGLYTRAQKATALAQQLRGKLHRLFHSPAGSNWIFAANGTDALNLAIHGLIRERCHVITSEAEHNSVLRPLATLRQRLGLHVTHVPVDEAGVLDPADVLRALRSDTRAIVVTHASNVTGAIQPLAELAAIARLAQSLLIVDAAQSAGHLPFDLTSLGIDLLATSGHKGLLGPHGTGLLYMAPGVEMLLEPQRQGGTGTKSLEELQPHEPPEKFEAGTLNMLGLAGLDAGVSYLLEHQAEIRAHELALTGELMEMLNAVPGVVPLGPRDPNARVGVVSFTVAAWDCHDVAAGLDATAGIEVRSGMHCAPRMVHRLGCEQGTVRVSLGPFNTRDDLHALAAHLRRLTAS